MKVRPQAILETTIPDDRVEADGEFVFFPGRTIIELLAERLAARGYKIHAPEHLHEMGWALVVESKRNYIEVRVSVIDEVYLSASYVPNFYDRLLGRKDDVYRPLLRDLDTILRADDRFSNIRWMAAGAQGPEFEHPIDG
jgi:hypothetical protein